MVWLVVVVLIAVSASSRTKIAFGSCWHQDLHNYSSTLWNSVAREKADTFVWTGDAIYGDHRVFLAKFVPTGTENMRKLYNKQLSDPSYQAVLNSLKHPPVGVYDDHDYGLNGAGADFDGKFESQQLFLDFLGESNSSERRRRNGLYGFQSFGPVTLLFLDVRFFETSSSRLGDEQWKFVESFFATDREGEKVIVVVSSIQAITGYDRPLQEGWSDHPECRRRLLNLLLNSKKKVLIISGDVHFAEISCVSSLKGHVVVEATSSGISHAWGERYAITPSHYTTEYVGNFDFFTMQTVVAYVTKLCVLLGRVFPNRYSASNDGILYKKIGDSAYFERNFGVIEFDSETDSLTVSLKNQYGNTELKADFDSLVSGKVCSVFAESWEIRPRIIAISLIAAILGVLVLLKQRRRSK